MKRFLKKLVIFVTIISVAFGSYLFLIYRHPELVDEAYYRFTTPKANSLILGTSRAGVGIVPSIINDELFQGKREIINHCFTFGTSNFGPRYLKEIKQKLEPNNNGTFIVAVDPWSLSIDKKSPDDTTSFIELKNHVFVGGLSSSSENPNIEYLRKYWSNRLNPIIILFKKFSNHKGLWILRKDGWMDIDVPCDSATVRARIDRGMSDYTKDEMKLSEVRINYLEQIIQFLQKEGTVYLVRMPVTNEMKSLEFKQFPNFDDKINSISEKYNLHYFNFINSNSYKFVDVHHMQKESAFKVTRQICDSILQVKK